MKNGSGLIEEMILCQRRFLYAHIYSPQQMPISNLSIVKFFQMAIKYNLEFEACLLECYHHNHCALLHGSGDDLFLFLNKPRI